MKKIIAIEMNTDDGGYIEVAGELLQCKDCKYYDGRYCHNSRYDLDALDIPLIKSEEGFCDWAKEKEEE